MNMQKWKQPQIGDYVIYHDLLRDKHTKARILKIGPEWSADLFFPATGFTLPSVPFQAEPSHRSWSWI